MKALISPSKHPKIRKIIKDCLIEREEDKRVSGLLSTAFFEGGFVANFQTCRFLSVAVNPCRPEYILVGASDPMIRVYDRRMLDVCKRRSFFDGSYALAHIPVEVHAPVSIGIDPTERIVGVSE